ncbi:hypothetical protein BCR16_01735 [Ralstonia solanacearum FJAT-1458]|nr:hypothetical protein BCR16_01735 [Ralstonia solanacearum FJAT-1458]
MCKLTQSMGGSAAPSRDELHSAHDSRPLPPDRSLRENLLNLAVCVRNKIKDLDHLDGVRMQGVLRHQ